MTARPRLAHGTQLRLHNCKPHKTYDHGSEPELALIMSHTYPSIGEITKLCSHLGTSDASPFFDRVSSNVEWDVLGTHPAAGHFTTLADWKKGALGVINDVLKEPLKLTVVNVAGAGDQAWAVVELKAASVCKNGMPYNQVYAWVMRFDENGMIVQVRAYLDSALVQKAVDQNT